MAHQVATVALALRAAAGLPMLPVGELEPALLTLEAGAGIKDPDAVTDNCSALASDTGNQREADERLYIESSEI